MELKAEKPHHCIRISLTNQCNSRCIICNYANEKKNQLKFLTEDEIEQSIRLFKNAGIDKVLFTGGEVLLRPGIESILSRAIDIYGEDNVALQTNGILLDGFVEYLNETGLKNISVCLHSMDKHKYLRITQRNVLNRVLRGIKRVIKFNFNIQIDVVIMEGINDNEVNAFIGLLKNHEIKLRFIDVSMTNFAHLKGVSHTKLFLSIEELGYQLIAKNEQYCDRHEYSINGFLGTIVFIQPHNRDYCASCHLSQFSSEGDFKSSLCDEYPIDLASMLRSGVDHLVIKQLLVKKLKNKAPFNECVDKLLPNLDALSYFY